MEISNGKSPARLGTAPLGRLLLSLSLPGVASMITLALYNIIDTFWVARLGHEAIAALTIFLPVHITVIAIGGGTGAGISALVSRSFGEGNIEVTNHAGGQIFTLSLFGLLFTAAAWLFTRPITTALGATPDILEYTEQYFTMVSLGVPFFLLMIMSNGLLRGSGDTLRPMIFSITAQVLNIILDPLMIFGIGPFPEMGIRGAALATVISQVAGGTICLFYLIYGKSAFSIRPHHLRLDLAILRGVYRIGAPVMVVDLMESVMFALLNSILSRFGSLAIASGGIALRVADLAFMPVFGAANGLLPVIGYCFGAGLWPRLWRAVKTASFGLIGAMLAVTFLVELLAPQIVGIFSSEPGLVELGVPAIRIFLSSLSIFGLMIIFITTFQGLSRGREVLLLSLVRQLVFFMPLLLILSNLMGIYGAFITLPLTDVSGCLVAGLWLYREYRIQRKAVLSGG